MLKLLIFDLDGTLADTSVDIANAVNYAIEPYGVKPFSTEKIKVMVGSGITKLLHSLIPPEKIRRDSNLQNNQERQVVNRFLEYYSEHLLDNTEAYPHVKETLSKLVNYKKAVLSNKREVFSKKVLEGIGILEFFDIILGSDSVPEKKPSPVPVLEVLKRLGVSRHEAVIIGDSDYDIEAGLAAGVKTIAVTYGFRPKEILKDADFMIDDFGELLDILPKLNSFP